MKAAVIIVTRNQVVKRVDGEAVFKGSNNIANIIQMKSFVVEHFNIVTWVI